jgi:hypothetical protein
VIVTAQVVDGPPHRVDTADMSVVVVDLPAHRIAPGNVVAVAGPDHRSHQIVLPDDVEPGLPICVRGEELEVVIRLRD